MSFGFYRKGQNSLRHYTTVQVADRERALKLAHALNEHRRLIKRPNIEDWAREFSLLTKLFAGRRIDIVLSWYCANMQWQYAPKVFSARSFVTKFPQLEGSMQMFRKKNPDQIVISEDAKTIVTQLHPPNWPKAARTNLPVAVEYTLQFTKDFISRLRPIMRESSFARFVENEVESAFAFTLRYFMDVYERISWNPNWRGDILNHAITHASHEQFTIKGTAWAAEVDPDHKTNKWNELIGKLYQEGEDDEG